MILPERRAAFLAVVLSLLTAACGGAAAPPAPAGVALPPGCGPRALATAAAPGPGAAAAGPLPVDGASVDAQGLAAGPGGTLYASTAHALHTSGDGGGNWSSLPLPRGMAYGLQPLLAGPGGRLAGVIGDLLEVSPDRGVSWRAASPVNVFALAGGGANPGTLAALGGTVGPRGQSTLWLSPDWGNSWHGLPLGVPVLGAALAVSHGTVWAALGAPAGPAHLFQADLTGGGPAVAWTPAPPAASAGAVLGLSVTAGGRALLLTSGGLFVSDGPGAPWTAVPTPAGLPDAYLAVSGQDWLVVQDPSGGGSGRLWETADAGQHWRAPTVPAGYLGQPVAVGGAVWIPAEGGPYRLGAGGAAGAYHAQGIPAPVSFVASAALRPDRVVAGWSGGWFVSTDGGNRFQYTVPPGSDPLVSAQAAWTPDGTCLVALFGLTGIHPGQQPNAFLSGDDGAHWLALPPPSRSGIFSLVEYPAGSGIWWAVSGGRLYRTWPGRAAWRAVPLPAGAPVPEALSAGRRLWVRALDGSLWSAGAGPAGLVGAAPAWGAGQLSQGVAADPYSPSVVYAGIARTLDDGANWAVNAIGPSFWVPGQSWPRQPDGLAFLPGSPGPLLATAHHVLRDTGAGGWRTVWSAPNPSQFVTGVASAGSGLAYLAVQGAGLLRISVGGAWQAPPPPPGSGRWSDPSGWPQAPGLRAADPTDPAVVYSITPGGALSRSSDGGAHFGAPLQTHCCPGTPGARGGVSATALAVAPGQPSLLLLGLGRDPGTSAPAGLMRSTDSGASFTRSDLPAADAVTGIAIVSSTRAFAAAADALWTSGDGGRTWTPVPGPQGVLAVYASAGGTVLAGGRTPGANGTAALWLSSDGGATWRVSALTPPLWGLSGGVSAVLRLGDGTLLAGGTGLAASSDGGRTWQDVSSSVGDPGVETGGLQPAPGGAVSVRTSEGVFTYHP